MSVRQPRYSKEEVIRISDEIYERDLRAQLEPQRNGEIVAIDLDTGAWEVDPDQDTAADRLEARLPDAQILVLRVGPKHYITRFGAGRNQKASRLQKL